MPKSIQIEMSDATYDELVAAACANSGYKSMINGETNPVTPAEFANGVFKSFAKSQITQYRREGDDVLKAARATFANAAAQVQTALQGIPDRRQPVADDFATVTVFSE